MSRIGRSLALQFSLAAVFTAMVAALTLLIRIPVPATGGYINFGDTVIFVSALLFGPLVGGLSGGIGSAIADMIGYPVFAPFTFVIKGLEGFLIGKIGRGRSLPWSILACVVGGGVMVCGYFIAEAYVLMLGVPVALVEVPGNVSQAVTAGLIGIPLSQFLRRRIPSHAGL
ncbi:MAG: ECF transporter S component [Candidatus Bathyarchaeia archaeon]